MTFAEFAKLPEPQGFRYELHHGELVEVTFPKMTHVRVRSRLRRLLENAAASGTIETEFGFLALAEHEYRVADIAHISQERWDTIPPMITFTALPTL
jgi:Uma2 family endonuclease